MQGWNLWQIASDLQRFCVIKCKSSENYPPFSQFHWKLYASDKFSCNHIVKAFPPFPSSTVRLFIHFLWRHPILRANPVKFDIFSNENSPRIDSLLMIFQWCVFVWVCREKRIPFWGVAFMGRGNFLFRGTIKNIFPFFSRSFHHAAAIGFRSKEDIRTFVTKNDKTVCRK